MKLYQKVLLVLFAVLASVVSVWICTYFLTHMTETTQWTWFPTFTTEMVFLIIVIIGTAVAVSEIPTIKNREDE